MRILLIFITLLMIALLLAFTRRRKRLAAILLLLLIGTITPFLSIRQIQRQTLEKESPLSQLLRPFSTLERSSQDAGISHRGTSSANPFGVMLGSRSSPMTISKRVTIAKQLGVAYFRPNTVFLDRWNGSCIECETVLKSGLQLILTIRNNGSGFAGNPTTPPRDYETYKNNIAEVIDKYPPALLVVENEENSEALFYAGTPKDYQKQLKAACEVAHKRDIMCTNGGLVSSLVAGLVAEHYKNQGDPSKADEYLRRALEPEKYKLFTRPEETPRIKDQLEKGKALLGGYRSAGADYVNFHWYIADTQALSEAVEYLEQTTGLEALTNEIGQQKNESPGQVTSVMQAVVDLRLPIAVWFSIDVKGFGGARALIEENGDLRPNGEAFKQFIEQSF